MFKSIKNNKIKGLVKGGLLLAAACTALFAGSALADNNVTISAIATNVDTSAKSIAWLLSDVSLVAGIGFIMASFFKFHQHKMNPQQIPISQGITLLLIGAGLTLFPALIPVGSTALMGKDAKMAKTGGGDIKRLISG